MAILENWQKWTSFLGQNVVDAKDSGIPKKMIQQAAVQLGEYLANNVEPQNDQERVLADMWSVASEDEKHALASCVVKLVQDKNLQ